MLDILSLLPNFGKKVLECPRGKFDISLTESQIDRLSGVVRMHIRFGIANVCKTVAEVANIQPHKVHTLWKKLKKHFSPTTEKELCWKVDGFQKLSKEIYQ